jgi:transcriptional regulator with XRE-family HTH domain
MTIGGALKTLRKAHGFTQAEVASALNLSRTSYTKYENDVHMPNAEQIQLIANLFGVSPAEILTPIQSDGTKNIKPPKLTKPTLRSDHEKLLGVYDSLDEQSKTQLMSVAYLLMSQSLKAQGIDVQEMVEQQLHKIKDEGGENNDD